MSIATTSLQGYWKCDEASNSTRADSTGNGNDLTDVNTVAAAAGKVDNGASFIAANLESLQVADNASLSCGDIDFMFAVWVKLDVKIGTTKGIVTKDNGTTAREYSLQYNVGLDRFRFAVSSDGTTTTAVNADALGSVSTGVWYFIVCWHDSVANTINIQVNDGTVNSVSHTTGCNDGTRKFCLGSFDSTVFYLDGTIDEVSFWKRILSSAERTELYNSGFGDTYPFTISTVSKTVKPGGGGDYTSLVAWKNARKGNLRGRNTIEQALCFGGDLGTLILDTVDWDVDSSRYVQIIADPTAKQQGVKSTASTVAHISGGGTTPIENRLNYTQVADLSIDTSATLAVNLVGSSNCLLERLVMDGAGVQGNNSAASNVIRNCVVTTADVAFEANGNGVDLTIRNCTVIAGISGSGAFKVSNGGTITEENNYVRVTSGNVYQVVSGTINKGSHTATANTEATTQSLRSIEYSTKNFVNVNAGQEDVHLTATSALKDQGADLRSSGVTDDIDGSTRNLPFDIGADQNFEDTVVNVGPADFQVLDRYRYVPRSRVNIWRS